MLVQEIDQCLERIGTNNRVSIQEQDIFRRVVRLESGLMITLLPPVNPRLVRTDVRVHHEPQPFSVMAFWIRSARVVPGAVLANANMGIRHVIDFPSYRTKTVDSEMSNSIIGNNDQELHLSSSSTRTQFAQ